ncbi:MAG: SDR family oxidoreductase [Bacteroidia bacterium]|nr:SDR family oxidoreductase [Bacteroidia bacterium]
MPERQRVLITGAAGFLGWNIARGLTSVGVDVTGAWHQALPDRSVAASWVRFDLEMVGSVMPGLLRNFDAVVHCAAIASRAACDADPAQAQLINTTSARIIAECCAAAGVRLIHISTDLVFDGSDGPYHENAATSPVSVYGVTKAAAETAIHRIHPDAHSIRTALMYGPGPFNREGAMLAWTLSALRDGRPLRLYTNQYRSLLYAPDVAQLVRVLLHEEIAPGIIHAGGPERLSRYEAGCRIAAAYGFSTEGISATVLERKPPLSSTDDCSLDCSKTIERTGIQFTTVYDGLAAMRSM